MELLGLKGLGASKLLSNLVQADIIEPVSGHGKGKYKFKKQCISYLKFYKIFLEIVDTACRQSDVLFSAEEKREKEQNRNCADGLHKLQDKSSQNKKAFIGCNFQWKY